MKTLPRFVQARSPTCSRSSCSFWMQLSKGLCHSVLSLALVFVLFLQPSGLGRVEAGAAGPASVRFTAEGGCYGVYHIVKPGQTLYSIAALYGTTAYRIALCNRLSAYTVYVGQSILVPIYWPARGR